MHASGAERAHPQPCSLCPAQDPSGAVGMPDGGGDLDAQFTTMDLAFVRHGGMLCSDEVVCRMRDHKEQPISVLAKWIASRKVIAIDWRSSMLLPMFQFEPASFDLRPGCAEIVSELADFSSDWSIALWFAAPHPWLGDLPPVDVLSSRRHDVFLAARAARFVAHG